MKKILAFISEYREDSEESLYVCPDGSVVEGKHTNEAPFRYFLACSPDIREIVGIVTEQAKAAVDYLKNDVLDGHNVLFKEITFNSEDDFERDVLPKVIAEFESEDEIYLDTTGGFRDSVMQMMLITRVLSYKSVNTAMAVYSKYERPESGKPCKVNDVTKQFGSFDLLRGMDGISSYGNVRVLREYYFRSENKDETIEKLISSMEELNNAITLCRTGAIDDKLKEFLSALDDADKSGDPVMRAVLPSFKKKFDRKYTIPGLVKWCIENDMYQQAITVYNERVPKCVMDNYITVGKRAYIPQMKTYEDKDVVMFARSFLRMGYTLCDDHVDDFASNEYRAEIVTLDNLEYLIPRNGFKLSNNCSVEMIRSIGMDYLFIKALRNRTNHASTTSPENLKPLMEYLQEHEYPVIDEMNVEDVRRVLLAALEHLSFNQIGRKK